MSRGEGTEADGAPIGTLTCSMRCVVQCCVVWCSVGSAVDVSVLQCSVVYCGLGSIVQCSGHCVLCAIFLIPSFPDSFELAVEMFEYTEHILNLYNAG